MEQFFNEAKKSHIKADFKATFVCSAKFKYNQLSEGQKGNYFQEQFTTILTKFYTDKKNEKMRMGESSQQADKSLINQDQSDMNLQFDAWLEENPFTIVQKEKAKAAPVQMVHNAYSNPNVNQFNTTKFQNTTNARYTQNKSISNTPFFVQKNTPILAVKTTPITQPPNPVQNTYVPQKLPQTQYVPTTLPQNNYIPPVQKTEQNSRPYRVRFMEKLSQYLDCPQRFMITKQSLSYMMGGNKK